MRPLAKITLALTVAFVAIMVLIKSVLPDGWQEAIHESLIIPPAICHVLCFSLEGGPWLRVQLSSKPTKALGLISQGIYLWQQLSTAPTSYWSATGEHMYSSPAGQIILLLFPLLCLIAPSSEFLHDKPAIRHAKRWSRRPRECSAFVNVCD